ncbi:hypothetical protein CHGG_06041 [Chaetomium globosum CBS 148.51]|uniref:Zn(2)-C6 fungal-type domain-containing protein n=1 Tax=Chaetomium globosum (strain ATCC 6205 / CBS 148.51 / DSM 1962 / NBRC 6347 / NRRL 1970) TaxID=306901 RepID=Q2H5M4_CHAGB|nr:uncharacterized protein CHGG_06041 [Chaetomium globosum CBS 148.51]EAQ89422.1 hypothetical protein CHGG_06041 [Chaetomium globosum CBS 148.51]
MPPPMFQVAGRLLRFSARTFLSSLPFVRLGNTNACRLLSITNGPRARNCMVHPMERRGISHSAPYGHACMSCFKAKCRCVPRQNGDGCERLGLRCLRLKKPCTPSNSTRRRVHPDQKPNSDGRLTPFEDLVSLFHSRHNYKANAAAQQQQWAQSGFPSVEGICRLEALLDPFLEIPSNTTSANTPEPLDASTAACLETFRFHMLPNFPFIHFPAETTIQQLQYQRPFLFRAITCVASSTACEKRVRVAELKHLLSETVFGEKAENISQRNAMGHTMDLLLGLLVYVAWGWDHQFSGRLMTVAMSLVDEDHRHESWFQEWDVMAESAQIEAADEEAGASL